MAQRRSTRSTSASRRTSGARRGYSSGKSRKRVTGRAAPRKSARRSSTRSSNRAPQTVRIVLEHAGAAPVREGEAVGIGHKVAKAPRVKPRF